ncbi:MAG TPA: phosphoenolpyruvate carboxylase [Vicinamibacterales bacterium]|nr:phosphoenolpyruvate carboxylase [Vicinamibacterales bacterium]
MASSDPEGPLRADVSLLGTLLGDVVRDREGVEVFETVEQVRRLAKAARAGDEQAFETLRARVLGTLPLDEALPVARAFAHFLGLANIAEQHHRIRRRRQYLADPATAAQPGSFEEALPRLLAAGVTPADAQAALERLSIGLVLTAHPTEVSRRTILLKQNRLAALLAERDRPDLTAWERDENLDSLRRVIQELWETDEVRRGRLSPLDEVRWGLAIFEQTLWDAMPRFLRSLDRAAGRHLGAALPVTAAPIRFGSWMGGDRDGNPNVTPEVTWQTCLMARWVAAGLYLREVDALRSELSMTAASDELRAQARGEREPYRVVLRQLAARLRATQAWAAALLEYATPGPPAGPALAPGAAAMGVPADDPLLEDEELTGVFRLCYRSLVETGNGPIARGRLLDACRRAEVFGLTLARLDVRQDAARHDEAMEAIAGGQGAWRTWDERRRLDFLRPHLAGPSRLRLDVEAPREVREVIETFRVMARIPRSSLGAYVVTMASRPSDVLAVLALQQAAGVEPPLRVVPLLETGRDLQAAGEVIGGLLAVPEYRAAIGGRQEVMVGYSDSSKDVGRFSAGWRLYRAQEEIVEACRLAGVRLTIFHGRGGSVGRGGGPTHLAIRALPPGAVDASLRVTEQGEMIQAHWGLPELAVRTMEVYTTATLEATLRPGRGPTREWRERTDALAKVARNAYQAIVHQHPAFVEYFRAATPEVEIGRLNIGSRPARRSAGKGVGSLRAIPWQFAWTQTRLMLASWLGLEEALGGAAGPGDGKGDGLREMYREWPYFRVLLDLMEMVLAKADPAIAAEYDRHLVPPHLQPLGEELRRRLALAIDRVLAATGHATLLEENHVLRRSIAVRNPYVDPINLLQVELLSRLRSESSPDERLWTAFAVTVNGIAAGMRNTG